MKVYTGGAVDYAAMDRTHVWRHALEIAAPAFDWYCPICANGDKPDDLTIMLRNNEALKSADRAIFLLDGMFTVGTPLEIEAKVRQGPSSVCILHTVHRRPGLFVRWWQESGAHVAFTKSEALEWLMKSRT